MNRVVFLWPDAEAPYTADSPGQAQPSVKEFRVAGSRGAVVVCPGGGYEMKAAARGRSHRRNAQRGRRVRVCARLSRVALPYLAPLTDALRAIRVVRAMGYEKVGILAFPPAGI